MISLLLKGLTIKMILKRIYIVIFNICIAILLITNQLLAQNESIQASKYKGLTDSKSDNYKDGAYPNGSLVEGNDSYFYGMCQSGGSNKNGTIFKINGNGTFIKLRDLLHASDGSTPWGDLVDGGDGYYYGMCQSGGLNQRGTIFKINSNGDFIKLKDFTTIDGTSPYGSLIKGKDSYLYGMCTKGGKYGDGTIFKITSNGIFSKLRDLSNLKDGSAPFGNLEESSDGFFYGSCSSGGLIGYGTIFKINTKGDFIKIRDFSDIEGGGSPNGGLLQGIDGNFYGMCTNFGKNKSSGANRLGTIFKITNKGVYTTLRDLTLLDGGKSYGNLVQGKDKYFYGMCITGGANGFGTIFKINNSGDFIKLRDFNGILDGSNPGGSLVLSKDGFFYGMCTKGGANNQGTIFKISSNGDFIKLKDLFNKSDAD